jgi:demethylmenaquinone methyltransferase/2-methoxy-6-polyprenyl-1,4-benzoquinol methylase
MGDKKDQVRQMFDDISHRYDFLNHLLSFGLDHSWRRKVVTEIRRRWQGRTARLNILDVATGTGDLAFALFMLNPASVTAIDISSRMLEAGKQKAVRKKMDDRIRFIPGDAEHIPFPDHTFDAVTVAFGVRNFEDLPAGLNEMTRVLKPSGRVYILEFSYPSAFPLRQLYSVYSKGVIPLLGKRISRHTNAYSYLPRSVREFPKDEAFLQLMQEAGLRETGQKKLTGAIVTLYEGMK